MVAYRKSKAPAALQGLQGVKAPKTDFEDISFLKGLK